MTAAIIKLNSLPYAVRPAAQNNYLLPRGWRRFVFLLIGGIKIGCIALKFRRAGIHKFVYRLNAMFLPQAKNTLPCALQGKANAFIREAHALRLAQKLRRGRIN